MKLRISNTVSYAVEFVACNVDEFVVEAVASAKTFREKRSRRVHLGESGRNVIWGDPGYLHVLSGTRMVWINPGEIKTLPRGIQCFEPCTIKILPFRQADTLDAIEVEDEFTICASAQHVWRQCTDAYAWTIAIDNIVSEVEMALEAEDTQ